MKKRGKDEKEKYKRLKTKNQHKNNITTVER